MVCHALKRHGGAIWEKTSAETLQKGELWWKMENDCYCTVAVLNKLSGAFYSLVVGFSSWDIIFL